MLERMIAFIGTIILLVVVAISLLSYKNIDSIKRRGEVIAATFIINDEASHEKMILEAKKTRRHISYFIKQSDKDPYGKSNQNYYFIVTPSGKIIGYSSDKKVDAMIVKYLDPETNYFWKTKNYPVKTSELSK